MSQINLSATFDVRTCCTCGIHYAVPVKFIEERRNDHKTFYCPNGHRLHFPQESELEILKKQKEKLENLISRKDNIINEKCSEIRSLTNSKRALKAHLTIKKNKLKELGGNNEQ